MYTEALLLDGYSSINFGDGQELDIMPIRVTAEDTM